MKKGSFVLGLGVGIIAMSVLFMLLGSGLRNSHERAIIAFAAENSRLEEQLDSLSGREYTPAALSDEEVIQQATALGMTFAAETGYDEPGEEYYAEEPYEEYPYEDSYEDVVVAQAPPPAPTAPPAPPAPPVQPAATPAPPPAQPAATPAPIASPTPSPPQTGTAAQADEPSDDGLTADDSATGGTAIEVTIPSGSALQAISTILHEQGIVNDASAFTAFVVENGAGTRLRAGDFTIDQGADFNEVLQRLLGN